MAIPAMPQFPLAIEIAGKLYSQVASISLDKEERICSG